MQRWDPFKKTTAFLACTLALQTVFIVFLKSSTASVLTGYPLAGRLHYGAEPLAAAFLLGIGILLCLQREPSIIWGAYRRNTLILALCSLSLLAILSLLLAHPPDTANTWFNDMNGDAVRSAVFGAIRYSIIMSMLIPLLFIFFPQTFLRTYRTVFLIAGGSLAAYMWLSIVRIAIHRPLASVILQMSYGVLGLFTPQASMNSTDLVLGNGDFSVIIGPQCLGLDSVVLFLSVWPFLWYMASRNRVINHTHAAWGLISGIIILMLLNIIRIVLIMLVGSLLPQTGVELFHGGVGGLLFFAVLIALLPLLRERRQ